MSEKRIDFLTGAACFGAVIAGFLGIVASIMSLFSMNLVGAGVSVIGTSLAFGFLANAVLRD